MTGCLETATLPSGAMYGIPVALEPLHIMFQFFGFSLWADENRRSPDILGYSSSDATEFPGRNGSCVWSGACITLLRCRDGRTDCFGAWERLTLVQADPLRVPLLERLNERRPIGHGHRDNRISPNGRGYSRPCRERTKRRATPCELTHQEVAPHHLNDGGA